MTWKGVPCPRRLVRLIIGAVRSPLRVVSYNVRYFGHALKGLASTRASQRGIAARIAQLDPLADLVCLQEIETISLRSRVAFRGMHRAETQLAAFMREVDVAFDGRARASPYESFYFRAHVNQLRGVPISTTGLAILVNTRRLQVDHHNVEAPERITHHQVERWKDRKQTRICAHLRFITASGPLHVFNTHLSLPSPFAREFWSERRRMGWGPNQLHEARTLAVFVRRHAQDEPFLVCGDFNSAPSSPVFRYLTEEAGFASAQVTLGQIDPEDPRAFPTAGFMRLRMHLDHLFFGNGVSFLDLEDTARFGDRRSDFAGLSDHVPLIGRFRVG
jgi:endonuclease/exonuclease/phosphatase family metal-dependent hydrolase